jgi:hypothetical protein
MRSDAMAGPVIVEVAVEAPADEVWRALRDPQEIRRWHGWDFEEGGGLDGEIREIYFGAARADAARLTLDTGAGAFVLEPHDATTIVRVTRTAPEGHDDWSGLYDEINEGWLSFVQQLRLYLERHAGEDRRTIHLEREIPVPEGETWFRSEHQTGVLLGDYGLMIAARGRTIVSTYGLSDDAFDALARHLG